MDPHINVNLVGGGGYLISVRQIKGVAGGGG